MEEINRENEFEKVEQDIMPAGPNNPPWNSLVAFLLWMTSIGLVFVLPALFVLPYFRFKGIETTGNPDLESIFVGDPNAVAIGLGATAVAHLLTLLFAWIIVTKYREYSFKDMVGWQWGGFKFWHGVAILVSVIALAMLLANLLGTPENEMTRLLKSSRMAVYMVAILATFSAPIVEEVVYRGVLYSAFQKTFNPAFAVVFVTLIFTIVHVAQYRPDYGAIISLCFLSLLITLVRAKTENLLPCIAIHLVFNGLQSIFLILEPFFVQPEGAKTVPETSASVLEHILKIALTM